MSYSWLDTKYQERKIAYRDIKAKFNIAVFEAKNPC